MAGRTDEGIDQARQALRIQPKYMLAMHNLTLAYLSKKDFTRARFWLREALDIAPDDTQLKQLRTKVRVAGWVHAARGLPRKLLGR
jgi:tetratricopeptide (TPR) repeat protein